MNWRERPSHHITTTNKHLLFVCLLKSTVRVSHLQSIWSNEHSNNLIQFVFFFVCIDNEISSRTRNEANALESSQCVDAAAAAVWKKLWFAVRLNWDFRLWYNQEENRLIATLFSFTFSWRHSFTLIIIYLT